MDTGPGSRKSGIGKTGGMQPTANRLPARAAHRHIPDDRREVPSPGSRLPAHGSASGCK